MKKSFIAQHVLAGLLIIPGAGLASENKGESVFSPLTISGKTKTEQDVGSSAATYHKPGAYSSRNFNQNLQNVDETFRSMPGTYTQIDQAQGMVSVNIRGMSGLGRVNTMVDGVTQTYFGQAPTSYHGGLGNRDAGVLIDPNFLVGVDVTRGNSSGSQGVNSLAGSANIRTIDLDDVIREGRKAGALSRFSAGSNGFGRSGMLSLAGTTSIFTHGSIGALAGISGSKSYGEYKNGASESSKDFIGDDVQFMDSRPRSQLYKVYFNPDQYNKLEAAARHYDNTFTRRDIRSADYYLKYSYAPPSELIDVYALASASRSSQGYFPNSLYNFNNVTVRNKSNALDINNTSRFTLANVDVSWLLGSKLMDTRYSRTFSQNIATESNDFAPAGIQKIASVYTGLSLNKGIYQLDVNANYTHNKTRGHKPACEANEKCFPQGAATLLINSKSLNPQATFSANVTPWLQPFVSWSYSTRVPNVQEIFFSNEGGASMNPFLKPEMANTWETGFNINKHGLFTEADTFRIKALAYRSRIKDYIASNSFFLRNGNLVPSYHREVKADFHAQIYTNTPYPVTSTGYEIEAIYDAGFAFVNISWSNQHTDQPTSVTSNTRLGFGYGDISDLPDNYSSINLGTRLFDEKLVIGGLVKLTGKTKGLDPDGVTGDKNDAVQLKKQDIPSIPAIIDLYSSYQLTNNIALSLTVQNLTNRNYAPALNRLNQISYGVPESQSIPTTSRGRTWIFSGQVRF